MDYPGGCYRSSLALSPSDLTNLTLSLALVHLTPYSVPSTIRIPQDFTFYITYIPLVLAEAMPSLECARCASACMGETYDADTTRPRLQSVESTRDFWRVGFGRAITWRGWHARFLILRGGPVDQETGEMSVRWARD